MLIIAGGVIEIDPEYQELKYLRQQWIMHLVINNHYVLCPQILIVNVKIDYFL